MASGDAVRRLLMESRSEALCDSCLAVTCGTTLTVMQDVTKLVRGQDDISVAPSCTSCGRSVPAIAYRPKCSHCSLPIGSKDLIIETDAFHVHCLRRLAADHTIQTTRALSDRSRTLIEESRRRMREGHGWPELLAE